MPVYFGYLTEGQKHMLQRVLADRKGFTPYYYGIDVQCDLFHHSCREDDCLNHFYTVKLMPPGSMRLRMRGHDFEFPTIKYELNK